MTDNFDLIRCYMKELGIPETNGKDSDDVFEIELVRRGKDNPGMPAANYNFKNYYVDSLERLDKFADEIKKCCDIFRLRAYVSVNVKSKRKLQLQCLKAISDKLLNEDSHNPWKTFSSTFGKTVPDKDKKRWVIDIDFQDDADDDEYINSVMKTVNSCQSGYKDNVIMMIPTKSGVHLITHPFNLKEYMDKMDELVKNVWEDNVDIPDIKENHLTLLYENI